MIILWFAYETAGCNTVESVFGDSVVDTSTDEL